METAIRDAGELCRRLELPADLALAGGRAAGSFPVFAPLAYVAKMRPGDPADPLLRQVLPLSEELVPVAGFSSDPVADLVARRGPGLLQKYHGRVLLITTGTCAIHCRYCFRRHFPYQEGPSRAELIRVAVAEVAAEPTVDEVILSGGDPLTLPDSQLAELAQALAAIPHLRRLRVHTRLPIVIPERVTPELLDWLRGTRLTPILVVHANHPRELDDSVAESLTRLVDHGIPVLNQSVLLRGVNDEARTLVELSRRLIELRVVPYYLHQLDQVAGAAHFEVPEEHGRELLQRLRAALPGYAVPRYVREQPGDVGKAWLS
jgi:EF-P beta-lysylation protein EpmB